MALEPATTTASLEGGKWTCPMHPQIVRDQPGRCPSCGMALEPASGEKVGRVEWSLHRTLRKRGVLFGAIAGIGLIGIYVATLGLANSFDHVLEEVARLWYWMLPLVFGFSVQVGLFAYARGAARASHASAHARGVVASGSASTVSMVACCAHHLTDVLPVVGFAGAAAVLATYQSLFLLLGVLSNLVGLVYVLGMLRRHGFFPARASFLSSLLRWPVDRALVPAVVIAAVVFIAALLKSVT
jgi:hypothetical protein